MRPPSACAAALALSAASVAAAPAPPPTTLAWPLHGSAGMLPFCAWDCSEVPVGAHVPAGSLRLGPDTTYCDGAVDLWIPYSHYGGMEWHENCVRAFSHSHAQGAGLGDGGILGVMVARATPGGPTLAIPVNADPAPYRSNFSHANETTRPGYYSAWLDQAATRAEMAVSGPRAGVHRYTCTGTADAAPCVLFADACHRTHTNDCGQGSVTLAPAGDAAGGLTLVAELLETGAFADDCGGVPVYLAAYVAATVGGAPVPAAPTLGYWADGALVPASSPNASSTGASGSLGAFASWAGPATPASPPVVITVHVGVSYVSVAAARANLAVEQQGGNPAGPFVVGFDAAATVADAAWGAAMSAIVVNDVGYTDADLAAHRRRMAADTEGAARMAALLRVPGAEPSAAAVNGLARAAVAAWMETPAGATWVARSGANTSDPAAALDALVREGGGVPHPARTAALAGPAAAAAMGGLVLPPHSVGMPPAERLGFFYSSFYHALAAPTVYSDADGGYMGLDRAQHRVTWRGGGGSFISDLSLWDVYRSQTPLLAMLSPVTASDLFYSMMAMFNQTNYTHVPHWVWANCETGVMPGSHGLAVLADFLTKGIPGPPASALFAAAAAQLSSQDADSGYAGLGFVPVPADGSSSNGASLTMEYAFDDFVGSVIAAAAGQAGNATRWLARSKSYANVWLPSAGGICPRFPNGTFPSCPPQDLAPILLNKWYTEGDGLQWTFSVPHDVPGLISLFPSPTAFVGQLQGMFANTSLWPLNALPNPFYWAGNEPGLLAPWEFSWVNSDAWRTQYWVRWVLDTYYALTPDGVPGNDDFGETNAWAVWACLGLYPVTATGTYVLTSPCFANVTLQLPAADAAFAGYAHAPSGGVGVGGGSAAVPVPLLNIVAHNFTASNVYVARAVLNGVDQPTPIVTHAQLLPPLVTPRPGEDAAEHAARVRAEAGASLLEFYLTDVPMQWGNGQPAVPLV